MGRFGFGSSPDIGWPVDDDPRSLALKPGKEELIPHVS
jgi:hypothetical protein